MESEIVMIKDKTPVNEPALQRARAGEIVVNTTKTLENELAI